MSDTPPDRDQASAAPEGPRNPWVRWLLWAILVPVLYVLSYGPAVRLVGKRYLPEALLKIYQPLLDLPDALAEPIFHYAEWWLK